MATSSHVFEFWKVAEKPFISLWDAITQYHRPDGLKIEIYILSFGSCNPPGHELAGLISGKALLPYLQITAVCKRLTESWRRRSGERVCILCGISYKNTNPRR